MPATVIDLRTGSTRDSHGTGIVANGGCSVGWHRVE